MTTPASTSPTPSLVERLQYVQSILPVAALEVDEFGRDLFQAISNELGRIIREVEAEEISPPRNDPLDRSSHRFDDGDHLVEEQIPR
jgi:hypothetical protein